jgi:hypothetical protein
MPDNITAKYLGSIPRQNATVVPIYSAVTPSRPGTPGEAEEAPVASSPLTAAEMTYRVVKKLLDELPPAEQAECLRRLSKDIFVSVTT